MATKTIAVKPWYKIIERSADEIVVRMPKKFESLFVDAENLYLESEEYKNDPVAFVAHSKQEAIQYLDALKKGN